MLRLGARARRCRPPWVRLCATHRPVAASVAERVVLSTMVSADSPIDELWRQTANSMKLIDDFNHRHARRRRAAVGSMVQFLRDHNVLLHSVPRFDDKTKTWNVTSDFGRLTVVGEALLRSDVLRRYKSLTRASKLTANELVELTNAAISPASLNRWYDLHGMKGLLRPKPARRKFPVADALPGRVVCATLAELHWFVVKTKATDRTHNNALFPPSDALILHVLAAHVVESFLSGLVVEPLLPTVARLKPRWVNVRCSRADQFFAPARRSKRLDIATAASPATEALVAARADASSAALPLSAGLASTKLAPIVSKTTPRLKWSRLTRAHVFAPQAGEAVVRLPLSAVQSAAERGALPNVPLIPVGYALA